LSKSNQALAYIMSLLHISGQHLADAILVSRSLVSKWKNQKLPFNPSIYHFNNVVDAIITINKQQNTQTLERFLESVIPNLDKSDYHWLDNSLRLFLSGNIDYSIENKNKNKNKSLYTTNIDVYRDMTGKRAAIIDFFEYALSLKDRQEIFLSDMGNLSWVLDYPKFVNKWKNLMLELLNEGHHITVIHNSNRPESQIYKIIYNWLPLYFTGNLSSFYYQKMDDNISFPSLYVIKNHIAILSLNSSSAPDNYYTALYKDPFSVSQIENQINEYLESSSTLIEIYDYDLNDINVLSKKMVEKGRNDDELYLFARIPTFSTMSSETLLTVLKENDINPTLTEEILLIHKEIQGFFIKNKYFRRHFYDIDKIREYVTKDRIEYQEISTLAKKPVYVSNSAFKQHFSDLKSFVLKNENYELCLTSLSKFKIPKNSNILVRQNCFVYAYPQFAEKGLVYSTEDVIIKSFYTMLDRLWKRIPTINKDKNWVISQLDKHIK